MRKHAKSRTFLKRSAKIKNWFISFRVNIKVSRAALETLDPCYYLEACKDIGRNFLPSLEEFFSEAIQEINPKNQVTNILF